MNTTNHFHLRTATLALSAVLLASVSVASLAQNAANPVHQRTGNYLDSGNTTTESVLKTTLPAVNMQPGTPSDPNPRKGEPQHYNDLQARINALKNPPQSCLHQYHLAKAQAWHNFSRDQYHENAWQKRIQANTFNESEHIVKALETKVDPGMDTPHLSDAIKLRPDLWAMADKAKANIAANGGNLSSANNATCCAALETAFCEVQLVWSGHALANLGGWKRANGHVRMAEDLCQEAQSKTCVPAVVAYTPPPAPVSVAKPAPVPAPFIVVAPPPVPVVPTPAPTPTPSPTPKREPIPVNLAATALFYHDKSSVADILPESVQSLMNLAQQAKTMKIERISLTGYADVSNSTGSTAYNRNLALARAATIKTYLANLGLSIPEPQTDAKADTNPVKLDCPVPAGSNGVVKGSAAKAALEQYYQCLQPNRRVRVSVMGVM